MAARIECAGHQRHILRLVPVETLDADHYRIGRGLGEEAIKVRVRLRRAELPRECRRPRGVWIPQGDQLDRQVWEVREEVTEGVSGGAEEGNTQSALGLVGKHERFHG